MIYNKHRLLLDITLKKGGSMNWTVFVVVLAVGEGMIALQGWFAWKGWMWSPRDLQRQMNKGVGLPFLGHGGMWGDFIIISPLIAFILATYGDEWMIEQWIFAVVMGGMGSYIMHEQYKSGTLPGVHTRKGRLTRAGKVHFVYMAGAFAVL